MKRNERELNSSSLRLSLSSVASLDRVIRANLDVQRLSVDDFFSCYNLARAYELKGLYNEALSTYQKAINLNDSDPYVHISLADLLRRMERVNEAQSAYQRAIVLSPRLVIAHLHLARLLEGSGHIQEAIIRLKKALQVEPENHELHYFLARLYEKANFLNEASKRICTAVQYAPGHFYYHYYKAFIYFRLKNWNPALSALQLALNIEPEEINALVLLGKVYFYKACYQEALQCFQKVLEVEANQLESLYYSGKISLVHRNTAAAEKCFFRVFAINSDFRHAYFDLAQLYILNKEWAKALHYLHQCPKAEQDNNFWLMEAQVLYQLGQPLEALSIVNRLVEQRLFKSELYLLWGDILIYLRKPEDAKQKFRIALDLSPESSELCLRLANLEEMLGNPLEAEKYALQASSQAASPPSNLLLENVIISTDEPSLEQDIEAIRQQIKRQPEDGHLYLNYGDLLFAVGEIDKALQQWHIGRALSPADSEFVYRISEALRLRGDLTASNSCLEELQANPNFALSAKLGLARNNFEAGNIFEARELLESLTLNFSDSLEPWLLLLKIARFCDDDPDIQRIAVNILKLDEQNIVAKAALGTLAMKQANINRARDLYLDIANQTAYQDRESLFNLGLIEKIKGNFEQSNDYFLRIIAFRPEDAYSYYNLGLNFMSLGNYFMAEHHFKTALRWEPADYSSRLHLAKLYQEQGSWEKAIEHLLLLTKAGTDAMVSFYLGICFSSLTQQAKAVYYYEEALRFEYQDPAIYYYLALSLSDLGEKQKALDNIEKGLSFCQDEDTVFSFLRELRAKLQFD